MLRTAPYLDLYGLFRVALAEFDRLWEISHDRRYIPFIAALPRALRNLGPVFLGLGGSFYQTSKLGHCPADQPAKKAAERSTERGAGPCSTGLRSRTKQVPDKSEYRQLGGRCQLARYRHGAAFVRVA